MQQHICSAIGCNKGQPHSFRTESFHNTPPVIYMSKALCADNSPVQPEVVAQRNPSIDRLVTLLVRSLL